jgi:hypothetical protein
VPDECECGDVNEDGRLNTRDALHLLLFLTGHTPPGFTVAKCNVSGKPGVDAKSCTWSDFAALRSRLERGWGPRRHQPRFPPLCRPPPPVVPPSDVCVAPAPAS